MPHSGCFVFPGQGSQSIGMLKTFDKDEIEFLEQSFKRLFDFDLLSIIQNGPSESLNTTSITQPALLATSYIYFQQLKNKLTNYLDINYFSGHSLGEFSSLVCANSITLDDALSLVHKRGQYMEECDVGSMSAVIGADSKELDNLCNEISLKTGLVVESANINSNSQIVVAGHKEAVQEVCSKLKEMKIRSITLKVSVPSHTKLMVPAQKKLQKEFDSVNLGMPDTKIIQYNHDAEEVKASTDIQKIVQNIINQMTLPVNWLAVCDYIKLKNTFTIECGPNKVLTKLCRSNDIQNVFDSSLESLNNLIQSSYE